MVDSIAPILFIIIAAGFVIAFMLLTHRMPSEESRLREWAAQNKYTFLSLEPEVRDHYVPIRHAFTRDLARGPRVWLAEIQTQGAPPRRAKLWFDLGTTVICEWID